MPQSPSKNSGAVPESILSFENVSKTFVSDLDREIQALKNIHLKIQPGRFVTIVGATGSGKTTLLDLASGLLKPSKGCIHHQHSLNLKSDIAYVFQHYTLLPWLTVLKNVAFGLRLRGQSYEKRNKTAKDWIDKVGLTGFEKAYPHELSGGMRQRTAIAQALAVEPKLLLMDEPFGSLDDSTRADLQNILIELHQQSQTTILFVTHNIDEAIYLADRVIALSPSPGTVLEDITVDIKKPRNRTSNVFNELFLEIRNIITR
ncbi:MAG: ABC transporter ATP-binding protein [Planctomycetota bacterium]